MLLNLSNHPLSSWSPKQKQEAEKQFGHIEDMPFPNIDPNSTIEAIEELAREMLPNILAQRPKAVHLMGELTFSYCLVRLLQEHGIHCIASTTTRQSKELPDGQKLSQFEFVQFRPYPRYD
jgi:plasmid stabilization system protein ParE